MYKTTKNSKDRESNAWCWIFLQKESDCSESCYRLNSKELNDCKKIKIKKKQTQFILARLILKTILAHVLDIDNPRSINLKKKNGKLVCENFKKQKNKKLDFSLSYSENIIAIALGFNCSIGIDIEKIKRAPLRIAEHFFHAKEVDSIKNNLDQNKMFYQFWTLKEAFAKVTNLGMLKTIQKTQFNIANKGINLKIKNINLQNKKWYFNTWQVYNDYMMAIALKLNE